MPMLPSGQHIGIDPEPFLALMREAHLPKKVHHLFYITDWNSLWPWLDVVKFVTADSVKAVDDSNLSDDSNVLPDELVMQRTGFNLTQLSKVQQGWSEQDIDAFEGFLTDRAAEHFDEHVKTALRMQQAILNEGDIYSRTLAAWWVQGIHPAQDANWKPGDPEPVELQWDIYDAYALLSWYCRLFMQSAKSIENMPSAQAGAVTFWIFMKGEWQLDIDPIAENPRQQAELWRKTGLFDRRDEQQQAVLMQKSVDSIQRVWDSLPFERLQAMAPEAADLLQLIVLSSQVVENADA